MGKGPKGKARKKARRQAEIMALAEAAALARTTWLAESAGRVTPSGPGTNREHQEGGAATADAGSTGAAPTPLAEAVAPGSPGVPEATELADRLASLGTHLQRRLERETEDGLTRARLSALSLLVLGGPRTLGELAAAEHVRPPTMTRLVQAMEADGLVTRERHPSDGRSIVIRATSLGETLLDRGRGARTAAMAQAIASMDAPARLRLADGIDLVEHVVREAGRDARPPGV